MPRINIYGVKRDVNDGRACGAAEGTHVESGLAGEGEGGMI